MAIPRNLGNLAQGANSSGVLGTSKGGIGTTTGILSNCTVDGTNAIGFLAIPQNLQSGNYTLVASDAGKHIYRQSGSTCTWTIPPSSSVPYGIGTAITFINLSGTSTSIAITDDFMYLSPTASSGTRTLAAYGSATAIKVNANSWIISGSGLT